MKKHTFAPSAVALALCAVSAYGGTPWYPSPSDLGLSGSWSSGVILGLDYLWTGDMPTGTSPYVSVEFLDQNTSDNSLWMVVSAGGLNTTSQFVSDVGFNSSVSGLSFSNPTAGSVPGTGLTPDGQVNAPSVAFNASLPPLSNFSVLLGFDTANNATHHRLQGGEWFAEQITVSSGTITPASFLVKNGDGVYGAAHVQGIGPSANKSGKITTDTFTEVPEPSQFALAAGLGLLGFTVWRRSVRR